MGEISFASGNFGNAIKYYKRSLGAEPDNALIRHHLALTMLRLDRKEEAKTELERIIRHSPEYIESQNDLAIILLSEGDINNALVYFSNSLNINNNNPKALYYKGIILVNSGSVQEGLNHLKSVISLNDPEYSAKAGEFVKTFEAQNFNAYSNSLGQ